MALSPEQQTNIVNELSTKLQQINENFLVSTEMPENKSLDKFSQVDCFIGSEPLLVYIYVEQGSLRDLNLSY